ncbi:hypothetical protein TrCOL_g4588 [Triparma columacea]|uniref:Threonylcarbamoyl-AMP synthase n=1 Tax=Triparma columacea TaxID=722753 RepID=A0A9W7GDR0_9STRA|nr:hypothetical protein TrCOL_g4588 [Triparma columacea]
MEGTSRPITISSSLSSKVALNAPRRSLVQRTHSPKVRPNGNGEALSVEKTWQGAAATAAMGGGPCSPMAIGTPTGAVTATTPSTLQSCTPKTSFAAKGMRAKLLPPTVAGVEEASERLRSGKLLAFPTETVYGLGANALIESAVVSIFTCKGRPMTDPLIIHIPDAASALKCVEFAEGAAGEEISEGRAVFERLTEVFWPGALTIVAKAKKHIPLKVSAGTGFVGVRCPSHPLAQRILAACGVPVAAPSANRFGHVSPTKAAHVMNDLGMSDIAVMNGEDKRELFAVPTCEIGIESTVVKINDETREVIVLRRGAITQRELEEVMKGVSGRGQGEGVFQKVIEWKVVVVNTHEEMKGEGEEDGDGRVIKKRRKIENTEVVNGEGHIAPGQLLTHYAPDGMDCFLVRPNKLKTNNELDRLKHKVQELDVEGATGGACVVIDFNGALARCGLGEGSQGVVGYKDLSKKGIVKEAAKNLFAFLRWSEELRGVAGRVLIADLAVVKDSDEVAGISDRCFRSASGKVIELS